MHKTGNPSPSVSPVSTIQLLTDMAASLSPTMCESPDLNRFTATPTPTTQPTSKTTYQTRSSLSVGQIDFQQVFLQAVEKDLLRGEAGIVVGEAGLQEREEDSRQQVRDPGVIKVIQEEEVMPLEILGTAPRTRGRPGDQRRSDLPGRLPPLPEETDLFSQSARGGPNRVSKSLCLLAERLLSSLPQQGLPVRVELDQVARDLGTDIKRLYSVCNVFEALQLCTKQGKNTFNWHGLGHLVPSLVGLRQLAEQENMLDKYEVMVVRGRVGRWEEEVGQENLVPRMNFAMMTQKLLMFFLVLPAPKVLTMKTASQLLFGFLPRTRRQNTMGKLSEVSSILQSLQLVRRVRLTDTRQMQCQGQIAVQYVGREVEGLTLSSKMINNMPGCRNLESSGETERGAVSVKKRSVPCVQFTPDKVPLKITDGGGKTLNREVLKQILLPPNLLPNSNVWPVLAVIGEQLLKSGQVGPAGDFADKTKAENAELKKRLEKMVETEKKNKKEISRLKSEIESMRMNVKEFKCPI